MKKVQKLPEFYQGIFGVSENCFLCILLLQCLYRKDNWFKHKYMIMQICGKSVWNGV